MSKKQLKKSPFEGWASGIYQNKENDIRVLVFGGSIGVTPQNVKEYEEVVLNLELLPKDYPIDGADLNKENVPSTPNTVLVFRNVKSIEIMEKALADLKCALKQKQKE